MESENISNETNSLAVSEPIRQQTEAPAKNAGAKKTTGKSSRSRKKPIEQFEESLRIHGGKRAIKLQNDATFDGEPVSEIVLDFRKLTGRAIVDIEDEYAADGHQTASITPETSRGYLAYAAAHASGYPVDFIMDLIGVDFTEITSQVKLFLLGISRVTTEDTGETVPSPDES